MSMPICRGEDAEWRTFNDTWLRKIRNYVLYRMDIRISATELARRLGDVLGRIRYRGDSFVVERNGAPVARVVPVLDRPTARLGEVLGGWVGAGAVDPAFARDLEDVAGMDVPASDPWA
jgi:prevent-host-death family protein